MNPQQPRIAFVSGNLYLGGATTFLCNVAGELVRRGMPVSVSSVEDYQEMRADFEELRIPVTVHNHRRLIFEDRIGECLAALRAFQPTTVVACLSPISFEILRYLPPGIQRVGMVQSDDPNVYRCAAHYHRFLDAMVGVSTAIAARLHTIEAFRGLQIECVPYGVPMPPAINATVSGEGPLRILYLGRLGHEQKRVRLFPEIYRDLCQSGIPFRWTVAGMGSERSFLEANMRGGGADQEVVFTGAVDYRRVPALLAQQDVLLLASTFEGLPLSLLEAMGAGIVPVVSDLESGIRDVVTPDCGLLVAVDDIPGYAKALIHLHRNRDELAAKRIAARAAVYPAFSVAAMTDLWLTRVAAAPSQPVEWPSNFAVGAPLAKKSGLRYSALGRTVRRTLIKLRGLSGNRCKTQ